MQRRSTLPILEINIGALLDEFLDNIQLAYLLNPIQLVEHRLHYKKKQNAMLPILHFHHGLFWPRWR